MCEPFISSEFAGQVNVALRGDLQPFSHKKAQKAQTRKSVFPQLLTHHPAMHNASHGGIASYFADTVD